MCNLASCYVGVPKNHQECDWNISNVVGMSYEYLERSWNEVGMQLKYISGWNVVGKF